MRDFNSRSIAELSIRLYSDTSSLWCCCQSSLYFRFSRPNHSRCHPDSTGGSMQSAVSGRDQSWNASDRLDTRPLADCEWVACAGGDWRHSSRLERTSGTIEVLDSLLCSLHCSYSSILVSCLSSLDLLCLSLSPTVRPLQIINNTFNYQLKLISLCHIVNVIIICVTSLSLLTHPICSPRCLVDSAVDLSLPECTL